MSCGFGDYPKVEWAKPFAAYDDPVLWERCPILDRTVLKLDMPADAEHDAECVRVLAMQASRTPEVEERIEWEAVYGRVEEALLVAAGVKGDSPGAQVQWAQLCWMSDRIRPLIFGFKAQFARARPWHCCGDELQPLFGGAHPLFPGHGAYPSSHATHAYVFAGILQRVWPDRKKELYAEAARIAVHREVAGVHYPTDTLAGAQLAEQIVSAMFETKNPNADRLVDFKRDFGLR